MHLRFIAALLAFTSFASADDPVINRDGFKSRVVTASDGVRLHYLESGNGPAILFVPGWTGAAEFWAPQMRLLSASYRVVALDPRSQGDSEKTDEGNYTERRARDIHDIIGRLNLAPVVLVAWSRAVPESMSLVEQFGSTDIRAMVLVDGTLVRELTPESARRFHAEAREMLIDRKKYVSKQVPTMFSKPHSQDLYDSIGKANLKTPTSIAVALQADGLERDCRPALKKLDRPLMFVNRSGPGAVALAATVSKELPSARLEVMEGVGHALFLDDTERFNSMLQDFLRLISKTPSR